MSILLSALLIIFSAAINRAAGSDLFGVKLPGKPALYAAAVLGIAVWFLTPAPLILMPVWLYPALVILPEWAGRAGAALGPYQLAISWALAFLFWRIWEHGRWMDLRNDPADPNRAGVKRTAFERLVESVSFGLDVIALYWRHLTAWLGLALVWALGGPVWLLYAGPPFAALLAGAHYLARAINRNNFHFLAELIHGALWGALIIAVAP